MAAYEQYKDSGVKWLGDIPSHWDVGNMRQFFTERKELSESGQEMLLSVSEYKGITPAVNDSGENVSRSASLVGYKKCSAGDLIINIMLAWKRGLAVSSYDGIVSPAYCVFASHNIIPAYANYLLRTDTYVAEFKRNSTGIIDSRLRMYPDDFKNIKCIAPPIDEQKAIVAYLDRVTGEIDRAIEVQQQMIDALNERIQIIISNVVTKGLNPNVPLRDSGIDWLGEIPDHWAVGNMRQFFTERKELSESGQEMLLSVSEYKGITPAVNENGENVSRSASLVGYKKCYVGDLIINIMLAWKRGLAVSSYDGIVSPAYCVFASHNIIPAYSHYLLRTDRYVAEFKRNSTGIIDSRLRMYPDDFKNIKCIVPPIVEQKDIAKYLNTATQDLNKQIETCKRMIDLLTERKQIIINQVVTGKEKVI